MRHVSVVFLTVFLIAATSTFAAKSASPVNSKEFDPIPGSVCIDAGHGGSDVGTGNRLDSEAAALLSAVNTYFER